ETPCPCQARRIAERKARHDAARPSASARGYDGKWRTESKAFLVQNPHCTRAVDGKPCGKPATLVHHLVRHGGDMKLFWRRSNWAPRCTECHSGAEQAGEAR